tara:strand:+ start:45 stop:476 length:432 start_codon:yes stop_codon:yes gene_type:complete
MKKEKNLNFPNLEIMGNFGYYKPFELVDIYVEDQDSDQNKPLEKRKRKLLNYQKMMFIFDCEYIPSVAENQKEASERKKTSFMWFMVQASFTNLYGKNKGNELFLKMISTFFENSLINNCNTIIDTSENVKQLEFNFEGALHG